MVKKNSHALALPELLVAMCIMSFCTIVMFSLLKNANGSFFNADTNIDLRNSLRFASDKMSTELRNTGYVSGTAQFAILAGSGTDGSDIIRFAVPILCNSSMTTILNSSGNPAYWGGPLTWGCNSSSCMDSNNSCTTIEYRYIMYSLNTSQQLVRTVLNSSLTAVTGGTSIMATNIRDFRVTLSGATFTIVLTGQKVSPVKKTLTATYTSKVLINNQGG